MLRKTRSANKYPVYAHRTMGMYRMAMSCSNNILYAHRTYSMSCQVGNVQYVVMIIENNIL